MSSNILAIGPHVEGVIRIEANAGADAEGKDKLVFNGSMEVHSRVHAPAEAGSLPKHQAHPIADVLMKLPANAEAAKLKEIPIRVFFNKAQNALQSRYQAYDMTSSAPVCSGNGHKAIRHVRMELASEGSNVVDCPGPEVCAFALSGQAVCRRQVTMAVQIVGQNDPLSVFQLRSSSYFTHKALAGQLAYIEKRFGGLRHVPLKLQLWEASTRRSGYEAFDLFKLALDAPDEASAMAAAKAGRDAEATAGLDAGFDDVYMPKDAAELNRVGDDFELAETFYRERDGDAGPVRTGESQPVGKIASADNNLAANVLTATLSAARGATGAATH